MWTSICPPVASGVTGELTQDDPLRAGKGQGCRRASGCQTLAAGGGPSVARRGAGWVVQGPRVGVGVLLASVLPFVQGRSLRPELPSCGCVPRLPGRALNYRGNSSDTSLRGMWAEMECQRENRRLENRDRRSQK